MVPRAVLADPGDDLVLDCALAARADLIITGDRKRLLPLKAYQGIGMVSPKEAVERIAS
jgi:predicted nucleic acid-binding protein